MRSTHEFERIFLSHSIERDPHHRDRVAFYWQV
jgi:hypothetical protein